MAARSSQSGWTEWPYCMGYYNREDIPFQFALAEAFTICDTYHCSVMGPDLAQPHVLDDGHDRPRRMHGGPILNNTAPKGGYTWTTYAERLEQAGISWKVYQQKDNYGCNLLETFKIFQGSRERLAAAYESNGARRKGSSNTTPSNDNYPPSPGSFPPAINRNIRITCRRMARRLSPARSMRLRPIPMFGQNRVYSQLRRERRHLRSRAAARSSAGYASRVCERRLPIGGGFRVPCIIVSPWTTGGWVCSQPFDHTSVLQFLEQFTGVREPNISDWRRSTFGDLTSAFRIRQANIKAPLFARRPRTPDPGQRMKSRVCPNRSFLTPIRPHRNKSRSPQARLDPANVMAGQLPHDQNSS
jgi:phospholipase C